MIFPIEEQNKERCCFITNEHRMTYGQLGEFIKDMGLQLPARALVMQICSNTIGSVAGYVGFLENQCIPILIGKEWSSKVLDDFIGLYEPEYIWLPKIEAKQYSMDVIWEKEGYVLLKTTYVKKDKYENLGLLLSTSGSTGSPKLVRLSYGNFVENAKSIVKYLNLNQEERPITTLPMNYTYGLSIINSHLMVGATILLTDHTYVQKEFWDFFKKEEATSFGGVPYTYEILRKIRFFRMELPSLRTMTQAGGKLSKELHQMFVEYATNKNIQFIVMYGQTEATARISYLPWGDKKDKYGSIGIPIPNGKLMLWDEEGNQIQSAGQEGELIYCGANVALGYAEKKEDLLLGDEWKGLLHTGDIAKYDQDNYFYLVGRKKRFLKIFGNRLNLDELEQLIGKEFDQECACCGIDDRCYIFVLQEEICEKVQRFVEEVTKLHRRGFVVKNIQEIPKSEAGKIRYGQLEVYYDAMG